MFNQNNNSQLITRATRRVVEYSHAVPIQLPVTGRQRYDQNIFMLFNHSYDFRNLWSDSRELLTKNRNTHSALRDKLEILKAKNVSTNDNTWNDLHIFPSLNRFSMFRLDRVAYKNKVDEIYNSENRILYFQQMSTVSKSIADDILKTIYYTEGIQGISLLENSLRNIYSNGSFDPDCLRVYNIILYVAPFVLCDACSYMHITKNMVFQTPYEVIALYFDNYITTFPFRDLNLPLKIQLRVESVIPDSSIYFYYRALFHDALLGYGSRTVLLGSTITALTYAVNSRSALDTNSTPVSTIDTSTRSQVTPEDVDALIVFINNILWFV
jgi:hypothetical protein